ncbi:MAG: WbqC family protein [Sphingobacteriia bacterium]|nr:WbqC family protein [Sphingobacteriia bacterium]
MKVAIHQPHYFPWLGYLNKMARSDLFILMDEVQLTDGSNMYRNQLLTSSGIPKYITIPFFKNDYKQKTYKELEINDSVEWQKNHANFIKENYKRSPFFDEIWEVINPILTKHYTHLSEVVIESIYLIKQVYDIQTGIKLQSELDYPRDSKKNQLVLDLCLAIDADHYLSGNGAKKYMQIEPFTENNIKVTYQNYSQSDYIQNNGKTPFVPGLSSLDQLFNLGIEKSKETFHQQLLTFRNSD